MSEDQGKTVKKGVSGVGKVIKWVLLGILVIIVAVIAYSCYACTAVTRAVVDATIDTPIVRDAIREAAGGEVAGPIQITVEDPRDIPFLHRDPRITIGGTFEVTTNV